MFSVMCRHHMLDAVMTSICKQMTVQNLMCALICACCNAEGGLQAKMGICVYMKWATAIYPSSTCLPVHMTTQLALLSPQTHLS